MSTKHALSPRIRMPLLVLCCIFCTSTFTEAADWPAMCTDSLSPPIILADGSECKSWHDATVYTRTYHVDANAANASDSNPGTVDAPLKTIDRAAQLLRPGEKAVIHAGIYREFIEPVRGGDGPDAMIAYEAAPGEEVVIKGSRVLPPDLIVPKNNTPDNTAIFQCTLPGTMFEGLNLPDAEPYPGQDQVPDRDLRYPSVGNPFKTQNASELDISIMSWAKQWIGKLPYTLPRGLVFIDGMRLTQVAEASQLDTTPGSYYVVPNNDSKDVTLLLRPAADFDREKSQVEVTV